MEPVQMTVEIPEWLLDWPALVAAGGVAWYAAVAVLFRTTDAAYWLWNSDEAPVHQHDPITPGRAACLWLASPVLLGVLVPVVYGLICAWRGAVAAARGVAAAARPLGTALVPPWRRDGETGWRTPPHA